MSRINWRWMIPQIIIGIAVMAVLLLVPFFTGIFDSALDGKVATVKTFSNDGVRIQGFINLFIYLFNVMLVGLTVLNLAIFTMEETIPAWYAGSWLRFSLQTILNIVGFAIFCIIVFPYLAGLAELKSLQLLNGAPTTMFLCLLAAFVVQLLTHLFVAIPSNRRGMLRPERRK